MLSRDRVLVFDFDGTVSLGHGPIRSYARFIAAGLPAGLAVEFLGRFEAGLSDTPVDPDGHTRPIDGYDLVRLLAQRYDVTANARSAAYLASRRELATHAAPVTSPAGLADFLAEARPSAYLVLATNAPAIRIDEALSALGLAGAFDAVHTSVGKPAGFAPLLDNLLAVLPVGAPTAHLTSIGDVWENDLDPAHRLGATTALVGATPPAAATPTYRADHLHELYPALRAWLESDVPPAPAHPTSTTAFPTEKADQ
ncbi:HAD family hydrolase [Cryobacterium sp. PAMC25264]|uniref:HAD family hydrolase n=1 Tax=Cryobacterium sp. PAMC25264 TaxID=2861288 RepID=UPI001C636A93|nr:HAD family hydrolase [Cryobacterium sp. PAMC25264]QYF72903.1 HAD family hydrolase [Cryobacterium sp. PAMC25264]